MNQIFSELFKIVLPTIVGGIISFFITRYTCNRNIPLEKLEIAYNRVYYPIFRLVKNKNLNPEEVIQQSLIYLKKYDKYIDKSTVLAANYFLKCKNRILIKNAYRNFEDNIDSKNEYLRRKLGYLEPSYFTIYRYTSPLMKSKIRIICELMILYFSILTHPIFSYFNLCNNNYILLLYLVIIILIIEILYLVFRNIFIFIIGFICKSKIVLK